MNFGQSWSPRSPLLPDHGNLFAIANKQHDRSVHVKQTITPSHTDRATVSSAHTIAILDLNV